MTDTNFYLAVILAGPMALHTGMSELDLRGLFPFSEREFSTADGSWMCRLAEVSDLRPEVDRLSWYLVFERARGLGTHNDIRIRKLEIVTPAQQILEHGFPQDAEDRIRNWVSSDEEDGREEWL